ncbi:hypothetical protein [Sorangium sp. So ce128]|uniref:hypothetical protein n=1 Tax=Sorangium sp. So ce128 TaxID=3133281 RepID=UPI003F639842
MDLAKGMFGLTPATGERLAECGAVCLSEEGHETGVTLRLAGPFECAFTVHWQFVTDQMRRTYDDPDEATEEGACCIAILIMRQVLCDHEVVRRSRKPTGFDYWLGTEDPKQPLLFNDMARLEVSGIRTGTPTLVRARTKQKLKQTEQSDNTKLPAYVVIVEFGLPVANLAKR